MIVSSLKILFSTFPILLNHKLLILKLALFWSNNKDLIASLQKADIERKVDLGVILGQKILEFKKENNAKFDEIFEVIDEIIAKYKSDEEFRQQIKDIIKNKRGQIKIALFYYFLMYNIIKMKRIMF